MTLIKIISTSALDTIKSLTFVWEPRLEDLRTTSF